KRKPEELPTVPISHRPIIDVILIEQWGRRKTNQLGRGVDESVAVSVRLDINQPGTGADTKLLPGHEHFIRPGDRWRVTFMRAPTHPGSWNKQGGFRLEFDQQWEGHFPKVETGVVEGQKNASFVFRFSTLS